jgi:hypothetical protein
MSLYVLFPSITIKLPRILQLWKMEGAFLLENSLVDNMKTTNLDLKEKGNAAGDYNRKEELSLNFKIILLANTNINEQNFYEKQNKMEDPMVLVMDSETSKVIEYFKVVALDMNDLNAMFKLKILYTSSIPVDKVEHKYGAMFVGVKQNYYLNEEEEDAGTKLVRY